MSEFKAVMPNDYELMDRLTDIVVIKNSRAVSKAGRITCFLSF